MESRCKNQFKRPSRQPGNGDRLLKFLHPEQNGRVRVLANADFELMATEAYLARHIDKAPEEIGRQMGFKPGQVLRQAPVQEAGYHTEWSVS